VTPLLVVALVPLLIGVKLIYPWADENVYAELAQSKQTWFGVAFFVSRAALYAAVWIALAWVISFASPGFRTGAAGPGLALLIVTVTFASIDWVMSLDPRWHSTVYGLLLCVGHVVAALSLAIVVFVLAGGGRDEAGRKLLHDLGKLLLTGVTLWAYLSFSQFLIIWYGNLPQEIAWYMPRMSGVWGAVAVALVVLHFAAPFFILLSRSSKRSAGVMLGVAGAMLVIRFIDLSWLTAPSFEAGVHDAGGGGENTRPWWATGLDAALTLGVGALWLAWFLRLVRRGEPVVVESSAEEAASA
jgi:hypothetical protein